MKTVKVMLPLLALVFAVVTAIATPYFQKSAKGRNPVTEACVGGNLIAPEFHSEDDCLETNNTLRCQVEISVQGQDEIVPAYENGGTCPENSALFAEFVQP